MPYIYKKISFLTLSMEKGGAEMAIVNLINQLKDEYEIHLCLMQDFYQFEIPENVKLHLISNKKYGNIGNIAILPILAYRYFKLLRENKIDVSISFLERPNFIAVMAKMLGSGVRTLITVNSALAAWYKKDSMHGRIGRFLIKWLYPKADLVIPCAKYVQHELIEDFGIGKAKFQTIYNAVDLQNLKVQMAQPLEIPKNEFWFIHLGSFYEVKNHKLLIDAFLAFTAKYPGQAKLLLIGKGHLLPSIKEYVANKDEKEAIHVVGFAENPYNLIAAADCFVLSSNFEGLPTVVLEALACNRPVISTDCKSGPREILAPATDYTRFTTDRLEIAEHGILVPVGNKELMTAAMEEMFGNKDLRAMLMERTEIALIPFNIEKTVRAYVSAIEAY